MPCVIIRMGFCEAFCLFWFASVICFQYRIYTNLIILPRDRKELCTRALRVPLVWQYAGSLQSPLENALCVNECMIVSECYNIALPSKEHRNFINGM